MKLIFGMGCALLLSLLVFTGCGIKSSEYTATAKTVQVLKEYEGVKVTLNEFTALNPGENSQLCRFTTDVKTPHKMPYEMYIEKALKEELMMAGIYHKNSKIRLSGYLQEARASSSIGDAYWTYRIRISSSNGEYIILKIKKEYEASYLNAPACNDMATAFAPSIKELVYEIVTHPNFHKLVSDRT